MNGEHFRVVSVESVLWWSRHCLHRSNRWKIPNERYAEDSSVDQTYLVPNSASKYWCRCFSCRFNLKRTYVFSSSVGFSTYDRQISPKFENDVRLVPIRATWGGLRINFTPNGLSPNVGFRSWMILNARCSNWKEERINTIHAILSMFNVRHRRYILLELMLHQSSPHWSLLQRWFLSRMIEWSSVNRARKRESLLYLLERRLHQSLLLQPHWHHEPLISSSSFAVTNRRSRRLHHLQLLVHHRHFLGSRFEKWFSIDPSVFQCLCLPTSDVSVAKATFLLFFSFVVTVVGSLEAFSSASFSVPVGSSLGFFFFFFLLESNID